MSGTRLQYTVLETEVSFRPFLTGWNKKTEMIIPSSWVQLNYVVVIHEYLLKQTEHFCAEDFSLWNMTTFGRVDEFCLESENISTYLDLMEQFSLQMISYITFKQREDAKQFCSARSEKRHRESWKIYVHLKNRVKSLLGK